MYSGTDGDDPVKVLFLDIDGVVNNARTEKQRGDLICIDSDLASLIRRIVNNTGCEVVLSSSWRLFKHGRDEIERLVVKCFDITPKLRGPRGFEIQAWLMSHPEVERYAILDDADVLPDQRQNLFRTSWDVGLTDEIALGVESHLTKKPCNMAPDQSVFFSGRLRRNLQPGPRYDGNQRRDLGSRGGRRPRYC